MLKPTYQRHEKGTHQRWFLREKYREEGPRCQQKRRKPCEVFFLKVCYLDCAKFDRLLGVIVDDGYKVVTNVHLLRVTA